MENSTKSVAGLKINSFTESFNTDSFLRSRSSSDHEATAMMKAQFMSLWDGLDTDYNCQVSTKDNKKSNEILPSRTLCIEPFVKNSRLHVVIIAKRVSLTHSVSDYQYIVGMR